MAQRIWFITGCSRGFGLALARNALAHGDRVVASARRASDVAAALGHDADLLTLDLDVTSDAQIEQGVERALAQFGQIDILVNNAGYGMIGAIEETARDEARAIFEVNVMGLLAMTRAVLPAMRARGSGRIINVTSGGAYVGSPGWGVYGSTKWAVEGLTETLAQEVAAFGIKATAVALGSYATGFMDQACSTRAQMAEYARSSGLSRTLSKTPGAFGQKDVSLAAEVVYRATLEDDPPLNLPVGELALGIGRSAVARLARDLDRWADLSASGG